MFLVIEMSIVDHKRYLLDDVYWFIVFTEKFGCVTMKNGTNKFMIINENENLAINQVLVCNIKMLVAEIFL